MRNSLHSLSKIYFPLFRVRSVSGSGCEFSIRPSFPFRLSPSSSSALQRKAEVNLSRVPASGGFGDTKGKLEGMASASQQILNVKKWNIIYPVYINSKKTTAEGRRIGIAKACENPTCLEINDCCNHLKIPCAIELDKAYSRDFMQRGRVRVLLKRDDGSLYNPAISNKKQLLIRIAELVPKHPGRTKKQEVPSSSTTTTGPSKQGKGGKKK